MADRPFAVYHWYGMWVYITQSKALQRRQTRKRLSLKKKGRRIEETRRTSLQGKNEVYIHVDTHIDDAICELVVGLKKLKSEENRGDIFHCHFSPFPFTPAAFAYSWSTNAHNQKL